MRVMKFDAKGKFIKQWGKAGSGPSEFNNPHALGLDNKGRLYVADRVNNRIQISDSEIDEFLKTDPAAGNEPSLNLAHILIAVPEKAGAMQIQSLRNKALDIQQRASQGANFAQLAREFSDDARTRDQGGVFGMRPVSRLPELFLNEIGRAHV